MQFKRLVLATALGYLAIVTVVACAGSFASEMNTKVDLDSFRELARNAPCANVDNRLFFIDEVVLFWTREGSCPDNWYEQALFGETPEKVICQLHDSIAGPVYTCNDSTYEAMFWTMVHNLDKEDLGLGPNHTVESIHFQVEWPPGERFGHHAAFSKSAAGVILLCTPIGSKSHPCFFEEAV